MGSRCPQGHFPSSRGFERQISSLEDHQKQARATPETHSVELPGHVAALELAQFWRHLRPRGWLLTLALILRLPHKGCD